MVQEHHARNLHWDLRLEHDGALASWALPRGIPAHPDENRLAVHTEDHPLEYLEFEGEIPKGEYGAGTMSVWDRGTFEAEKFRENEVIATFHGERVRGRYALFQTRDKDWLIHRMDPPEDPGYEPMPDRLEPMLARSGKLPRDEQSVRVRGQVGRHPGRPLQRPRPHLAPGSQLHGLHPALSRGSGAGAHARRAAADPRRRGRGVRRRGPPQLRAPPDAHAPRLGLRRSAAHARHARHLRDLRPALSRRPLHDRRSLRGAPRAARAARAARAPRGARPAYHRGEGSALLEATENLGIEGIVAKRLDCPYDPGRRASGWIKIKNVRTQDVVIGGWTPGEGGRSGRLGALAVGTTEEAGLVYAGKVGTGFTEATLNMLVRELEPLRSDTAPSRDASRRRAPCSWSRGSWRRSSSASGRGAEPCARPRSRAFARTRIRKIAPVRKGKAGSAG